MFSLPVYITSLNSPSVSEDSLSDLFGELPTRSIILLEDIDAAGLTAKSRTSDSKGSTYEDNDDPD